MRLTLAGEASFLRSFFSSLAGSSLSGLVRRVGLLCSASENCGSSVGATRCYFGRIRHRTARQCWPVRPQMRHSPPQANAPFSKFANLESIEVGCMAC